MNQVDSIDATFLQGLELHKQGRLDEAEALYRAVLAKQPTHFDAVHLTGLLQYQRGRAEDAVAWIGRAISLNPDVADAHSNLGLALQALKRIDAALSSYQRAVQLNPNSPEAFNNLGNALQDLRRLPEAIAAYDRVLTLRPNFAEAHNNRGNALRALNRPEEALASYDQALRLWPTYAEALNNRGLVLHDLKRFDEAIPCCQRLVEIAPRHPYALGMLLTARLHCCDWSEYTALSSAIVAGIERGERVDMPLTVLWHTASQAVQLRCARIFSAAEIPVQSPLAAPGVVRSRHDRIRLAYLSGDFHMHTVTLLAAEIFEIHDRARFEVTGISYGADDGSDLRARVREAFDHFVDVRDANDRDAAQEIRRREADIVIDLTGYTAAYRPRILAHRPAPIQVNWLGYAATMGSDYHDYIVVDRHIVPERLDGGYSEKVVRLPETFMANERRRRVAEETPSRQDAGLPGTGFVFCSFNNPVKINPPVFDVWMRLLKAVPGSVLWLLGSNPGVVANLRREAQNRGVGPDRLVFAPRVPVETHLARHRLADLFLDTYPYGSHTTGNDALLTGLPMIAISGATFAARLSGSLVLAAGLPEELITGSLAEYEALALNLATTPERLGALRKRLMEQRPRAPLFDTDRLRRHLEAAYVLMYERWQRGEPPASIDVPPEPC